jgi:hypothetical protein
MIQSVLDALIQEKCLKRQHFMALLQHNVTHLNLSTGGLAANNDSVVKAITNRCPVSLPELFFLYQHFQVRAFSKIHTNLFIMILSFYRINLMHFFVNVENL